MRGWVFENVEVPGRLRGVSLEASGVTAVLGPNGSGKTTLLLVAAGVVRPLRGSIKGPERVGAAWQNPYLSFHRPTVIEELEYTCGSRGEAMRLLREAGLGHAAGRSPFTLSLGEARRLSILLAFSWGPDALVLDEPTAGLDNEWKGWAARLVRDAGVHSLIATHDVLFALAAADKAVSLRRGVKVYEGPVQGAPEAAVLVSRGVGSCEARCLIGL